MKAVKSSLDLAVYHASEVGCAGLGNVAYKYPLKEQGRVRNECEASKPASQIPQAWWDWERGEQWLLGICSAAARKLPGAGSAPVAHCAEGTLSSGQILMTKGEFSPVFYLFCQSCCVGRIWGRPINETKWREKTPQRINNDTRSC